MTITLEVYLVTISNVNKQLINKRLNFMKFKQILSIFFLIFMQLCKQTTNSDIPTVNILNDVSQFRLKYGNVCIHILKSFTA